MHILKYTSYRKDGIYGNFQFSSDHVPFMVTLSHAYPTPSGTYMPIVTPGTYQCLRGLHKLDDGVEFETFEIIGVKGHTGLLFHSGNFQKDTKGCTLCGASVARYDSDHDGKITPMDDSMLLRSKITFAAWMKRLDGVTSFMLEVI